MGNKYYHYYVEGEDDKKIVNALKTDFQLIKAGKVDVFNVVQNQLKESRLKVLKNGTTVILVFDTDTQNADILKQNIEILESYEAVKEVICIPQVNNLEDELIRSCAIKQIKELTDSKTNSEFKHDVLCVSNLHKKLQDHSFVFDKFWASKPKGNFKNIPNSVDKIKKV